MESSEKNIGLIPLFTIGYGNMPFATFVEKLQQHDIQYLADVRSQPYSRYQTDFNKAQLAEHLVKHNIRYVFLGDALGGRPPDPDCYTDGKVDYEQCRKKPFYQDGITRLETAFAKQVRLVLMCGCAKPEMCHRSKLIGVSLKRIGIPVMHILGDGTLLSQEAVMRLLDPTPDLFGESPILGMSRKRYRVEEEEEPPY